LKNLGMDKLSFVGDNVYYPSKTDDPVNDRAGYQKLHAALETSGWSWEDVLIYAIGNHEFPQGNSDAQVIADSLAVWQEECGYDLKQHQTYNGYHFISVASETNGNVYKSSEAYMKAEIEAALAADSTNDVDGVFPEGVIPNSTKPVFLLLHGPMSKTILNYSSNAVSADFVEYLSTRPQVINITAHMHLLAQHPEIICQDAGFTVFQSPMTAGGYHSQWQCTEEGNITDSVCSQGSFMEIKDGVVSFYRIDYLNGNYIGEPFVVDIPAIVADKTDDNAENDNDHMLYTTANRAAITTSSVAFPENAEVDVQVSGNAIRVTYPNTATVTSYDAYHQDNFVRAYKLEVVAPNGKVASTDTYQADFWRAEANRVESYTKNVGGLTHDTTYTVNVYPMTPFGSFGATISKEFTTDKLLVDDDAIRVEFESYAPTAQNKSSDYASAGGLFIAAQGGWISGTKAIARTEDGSDYTFTAEVDAPFAGEYTVEYAIGYLKSGNSVSEVEISIGDTVIGNNTTSTQIADMSIDGTYPWKHIPLTLFQGNKVTLAEGKNTITVKVSVPKTATQPFLFCMDYIEFTPVSTVVDLSAAERIEFESLKDAITPITDAAGKTYKPGTANGANSSGGKYLAIDSDKVDATTTLDIPIPIQVTETGMYKLEYVGINLNNVKFYLDSKEQGAIGGTVTKTQLETAKEMDADGTERYQTFSTKWYPAYKIAFNAELPKGAHTLIAEVSIRSASDSDIVHYLDYLDIIPNTKRLSKSSLTHFEFEDYRTEFTPKMPTEKTHEKASNGKYVYTGGGSKLANDSVTLSFYVAEAGTYEVDMVAAGADHLSTITMTVGDTTVYTINKSAGVDISGGTEFVSKSYPMRKHNFTMDLEEGFNKLVFDIAYRPNTNETTAYALDYITIMPEIEGVVSGDDVMRMEFESLAGKVPAIPLSSGSTFKPSAGNGALCSGKKYLYIDSAASNETYYAFSVNYLVKDAGNYHIKYVDTQGVSAFDVFLGGTNGTNLTSATTLTTPAEYHVNVGTNGTGESTSQNYYKYFSSSWAKPRVHEGQIYLEEGIQTITFRLKTRGGTNLDFAQYLDYFELAPVESFTVADGVATVKAVQDTAVTGNAILALYNGKEMVSLNSIDVTGKRVIDITAPANVTFTNAKVFVWGDLTNVTPLATPKTFTK
ncbi:MAG: hypothetical protein IJC78_07340, partial [Clostridia bacterium]|nr:hypothetical protein [Clostridia bacterium]